MYYATVRKDRFERNGFCDDRISDEPSNGIALAADTREVLRPLPNMMVSEVATPVTSVTPITPVADMEVTLGVVTPVMPVVMEVT